MTFDEILDKSLNSELSSIKQTVLRILTVINDPDSSASDLKSVIEMDPPLAAKLIKISNSSYYSRLNKVAEIQDAIVCIGFESVKQIALEQTVCELFKSDKNIYNYSRLGLWKQSLATALGCKLIYRRVFRERGENIYVAGLMQNIGIIVLDQFNNDSFVEVLKIARQDKRNLIDVENDIWGYNHAEIGMNLALNWEFPDDITFAIGKHHSTEEVDEEYEKMAFTIFLANYITHTCEIGYSDNPYPSKSSVRKALSKLNIKDVSLEMISKEVYSESIKAESAGLLK